MSLSLTALFVDTRRNFASSFRELLWPEVQLQDEKSTISLPHAFQRLVDAPFSMVFIGDTIAEGTDSFLRDVEKLGRRKTCLFVRMVSELPTEASRVPEEPGGFDLILSVKITQEDKAALLAKLDREFHKMEVSRRSEDLVDAVSLMLKEIDRAAGDAKRGRTRALNMLMQGLIRLHADFDQTLLEQYFETLAAMTAEAEPIRKLVREIPQEMLRMKLPKLNSKGYEGASSRVGDLILEKFGELTDTVKKE